MHGSILSTSNIFITSFRFLGTLKINIITPILEISKLRINDIKGLSGDNVVSVIAGFRPSYL